MFVKTSEEIERTINEIRITSFSKTMLFFYYHTHSDIVTQHM